MLGFRMAFLFPMVASHADHLMSFNVGRSALCILYIIYMHTGCRLHVQNAGLLTMIFWDPRDISWLFEGQESSHSKCQLWCFRFSGYDCDNDHATRSLSDIRSHLSLPLSMSLLLLLLLLLVVVVVVVVVGRMLPMVIVANMMRMMMMMMMMMMFAIITACVCYCIYDIVVLFLQFDIFHPDVRSLISDRCVISYLRINAPEFENSKVVVAANQLHIVVKCGLLL